MRILLILSILLLISSGVMAQKIELVRNSEPMKLIDNSGKKPKIYEYSYIYLIAKQKDYVITEGKNLQLVNLARGKFIELDGYIDNYKLISDTSQIEIGEIIRFREKGKVGLMQFPDKVLLPAVYKAIYPNSDYNDEAKYFLLEKGKKFQFYYPKTATYSVTFERIEKTELYIDNQLVYLPDNEAFLANVNGAIHIMRTNGNHYLLHPKYKEGVDINYSGLSMIACIKDGKYGFVDAYANQVIPFKYEWIELMDDLTIVKANGKYGLIGDMGREKIPCIYDKIEFDDFEALIVSKDGKSIQVGMNGNPNYELLPIQENGKFGFETESKDFRIPCTFQSVKAFKEGFAPVCSDGKWGYIVPTGYQAIATVYDDAGHFNTSLHAPVKQNGKWGVIDVYGNLVLDFKFDSINQQYDHFIILYDESGSYEFGYDKILRIKSLSSSKGNFTDSRDGKVYKTIKIGQQVWMAQNLDYKTDGSMYYENNEAYSARYGRLYSWKSALTACPSGWHLPSDDEWKILERVLGMPDEELNSMDYNRGSSMGHLLLMGSPIGFDVQMSGFLHGYTDAFYKLDQDCILWTSSPSGEDFAFTRSFSAGSSVIGRKDNMFREYALPVRCVKD